MTATQISKQHYHTTSATVLYSLTTHKQAVHLHSGGRDGAFYTLLSGVTDTNVQDHTPQEGI